MNRQIVEGWLVTTERPESSYGIPVYVARRCEHGEHIAHSFAEAIGCGLLRAVRRERNHTQAQAALLMGVPMNTVARWERRVTRPVGLSVGALREYLFNGGDGASFIF